MIPDVVYPVKLRGHDRELRYSLRSLKNIPHGNVYIVGECPKWVKNVIHIDVRQRRALTRFENSARNLLAACRDPRISDEFIWMNDDFYITRPIKKIPALHRGTLEEVISTEYEGKNSQYVRIMRHANDYLKKAGKPTYCYELHAPMMIRKQGYLDIYKLFRDRHQVPHGADRSLYGNFEAIGGTKVKDVKVYKPDGDIPDGPFVSSGPGALEGSFLEWLRGTFPERSDYERHT